MKIPLVSGFLEDDVYEQKLTDKFMNDVICNEDHFYHRIAKSLSGKKFEPTVYYMSQEKNEKIFTHKYGHSIIRVPARKINLDCTGRLSYEFSSVLFDTLKLLSR